MQNNAAALASAKTRSPPQVTDGNRGNTAKFYFVILKDCVLNSYNIFSGKRNDEEEVRIIWDTFPIMEKLDKADTIWFLNFILVTKKKELVVRKNSQFCHWNSPRAIFFRQRVRYSTIHFSTPQISIGGLNSKGMQWSLIKSPTTIRFSAKFSVFYILGPSHENYHKP